MYENMNRMDEEMFMEWHAEKKKIDGWKQGENYQRKWENVPSELKGKRKSERGIEEETSAHIDRL